MFHLEWMSLCERCADRMNIDNGCERDEKECRACGGKCHAKKIDTEAMDGIDNLEANI